MKQRKMISVDLYGMAGYGSTKTEAKQDAERQLVAATEGYYEARMRRFPAGQVGLLYRDLHGWNYSILHADRSETNGYALGGYPSRQDAERALRRHIAQNLIFVTEENGLEVLANEADRKDHQMYVAWQGYYKELRTQGYSDVDAHRLACEGRALCPPAA